LGKMNKTQFNERTPWKLFGSKVFLKGAVFLCLTKVLGGGVPGSRVSVREIFISTVFWADRKGDRKVKPIRTNSRKSVEACKVTEERRENKWWQRKPHGRKGQKRGWVRGT